MLEAILEAASIYRQVAEHAWHAKTPQRQARPKFHASSQFPLTVVLPCGRATAGSRRRC